MTDDMKNLKLILVVGIVMAIGIVFYLSGHSGLSGYFEPAPTSTPQSAPKNLNSPNAMNEQSAVTATPATNPVDAVANQQKLAQFSAFIKDEAKGLDRTNIQTEAKTLELRQRALKLDATEKNHLKNISINTELPVNERILSVYILTLTSDIASQNLVSDIAQTPMPDLGPINPHTEAEVKNAQELALRYMAIDKLVENFKSNPPQSEMAVAALQSLQNQSAQNPIPQVRKYANDELNKLTQK